MITTVRISIPPPALPDTTQPCPACGGQGVTGDTYTMPLDDGRQLQVDVFCLGCGGCGRADHDTCLPGVHALDPDEDLDDEGSEPPPGQIGDPECYSCAGRGWNCVSGWHAGDPEPSETVLLRVPCGCVENRAETVPEEDMDREALHGSAAAEAAAVEPPAAFTDALSTARLAGES